MTHSRVRDRSLAWRPGSTSRHVDRSTEVRAFTRKAPARKDRGDVIETIAEVVAPTRTEARKSRVALRTRLAGAAP